MDVQTLANAYIQAGAILKDARVKTYSCDVIWQKLNRVTRYLDAQAKIELREYLD
jgi:hypothetical protein